MSIAPVGRGPAIRQHPLVPRDQGLFPNRLNVRFKQPLHEQTLMEERPLAAQTIDQQRNGDRWYAVLSA